MTTRHTLPSKAASCRRRLDALRLEIVQIRHDLLISLVDWTLGRSVRVRLAELLAGSIGQILTRGFTERVRGSRSRRRPSTAHRSTRSGRAAPASRLAIVVVASPVVEDRSHPRSDLRIRFVQRQHAIRQKHVALARRRVESYLIPRAEGTDQGANPIRIRDVKSACSRALEHARACRPDRARLDREPLVENERIPAPALVEGSDDVVSPRMLSIREHDEGRLRIRHVVGRWNCAQAASIASLPRPDEHAQRALRSRRRSISPAHGGRRRAGRARDRSTRALGVRMAERLPDGFARRVDRVGLDHIHLLRDDSLRRQTERQRTQRAVEASRRPAPAPRPPRIPDRARFGAPCMSRLADATRSSRASCWPASQRLKAIVVVRHQEAPASSDCAPSRNCTGAEKPRNSEGTGSSSRPTKTKLCSASASSSTRVVSVPGPSPPRDGAASAPVRPEQPHANGKVQGLAIGRPAISKAVSG